MTPFALDFDSIFNSNLDKESEKGYDIMRQMASMKDVPLPASAAPKIDLKTAAIGSILAGILGNAEGAGGFLQGMIQGNQVKRQQMDQDEARKFQQAKMAQDRELGIMKTEAEIANQKANRLLSRQDQFNRRIDEGKKSLLDSQRNRRMAISQAFSRVQNPEDVDTIMSELSLQGINLSEPDMKLLEGVKAQAATRAKKAQQAKAFGAEMPRIRAIVSNQNIDPQTRQWNAAMLINMLRENPDSAMYLGTNPQMSEALIKDIMADSKRATLANQSGQWQVNNLIKEGRLKDAELVQKNLGNQIKQIEAKYAGEAFKLENETKKARIRDINNGILIAKQKLELDKKKFVQDLKEGGVKGRNLLTATAELNAWAKAQNEVLDANKKVEEADEMIRYWQGIKSKVAAGSIDDVTDSEIERSIMYYESQKNIAERNKQGAETQKEASLSKINSLNAEAPKPTTTNRAAELRKKYGY